MTHAPAARPLAVDWKSHLSAFLPLAVVVIGAAIAWGVLSDQVHGAQEGIRAQAAEIHDVQTRQNAQETLEAVSISRLDDLKSSVDQVGRHVDQLDDKIDRLGDRPR